MKIKTYALDTDNPPQIDPEVLEALDALQDHEIDYSDIPELGGDFWENDRWKDA